MLTAFLLFALQSGRQRAVKMPAQTTDWNIQVTSTGGFGGGGAGATSFYVITPAVPLDLDNILEVLIGPAGLHSRYRTLCATTP